MRWVRRWPGCICDSADFPATRTNDLRPDDWAAMLADFSARQLAAIDPELPDALATYLPELRAQWPDDLPTAIIHADLFPDNVLMLGNRVTGLIDFYFACRDIAAYDLAVTHAAWCFSNDGAHFDPAIAAALMTGYEGVRPLSVAERGALPLLARGAAMRFVATRCVDWIETPDGALVERKDPMAFVRRMRFYAHEGAAPFLSRPADGIPRP